MGIRRNLVLGGDGLIGNVLCEKLISIGEEALSLDLESGFDLRCENLERFRNYDFAWFLAWDVGGSKYISRKESQHEILLNNTTICEKVFDFLHKSRIDFVFTSSQLADLEYRFEFTPSYSITKKLGEVWTKELGGKIVRLWNVYGWEEPNPRSHVIPDLVIQGLTKDKIVLNTSGEEKRQFLYKTDCAEALLQVREMKGIDTFDVSAPPWHPVYEVGLEIGRQLDVPVFKGTRIGYGKIVEPKHLFGGWKPKIDLSTGISLVIKDAKEYLDNKLVK